MHHATRTILSLLARGLTTSEAAAQLDLPPDEVRARLRAAMTETGARSKLEAIIIAMRRGLI